MCLGPLPKTFYWSKAKKLPLWNKYVEAGLIVIGHGQQKDNVDDYILSRLLKNEILFKGTLPAKDLEFEAKCAEFKEAWEKHKQKMAVTGKTYNVTPKTTEK